MSARIWTVSLVPVLAVLTATGLFAAPAAEEAAEMAEPGMAVEGGFVSFATPGDYTAATGNAIDGYHEAPLLAARVADGSLPPVAERLPDEPLVIRPLEAIGSYGGSLVAPATGATWGGVDIHYGMLQMPVALNYDFTTTSPNLVKAVELSADAQTLTFTLRSGMRWSDGSPFGVDDFLFWHQDIFLNEEISPVTPRHFTRSGEPMQMTSPDDQTIVLSFAAPYPSIINRFAWRAPNVIPFAPRAFLSQFHKTYNDQADAQAKEAGFEDWTQFFGAKAAFDEAQQEVGIPGVDPWVLVEVDSTGNKYYDRNPYYWKVDVAGNQLPYADEMHRMLIDSVDVMNLKAVAGEFTHSGFHMTIDNMPLYKENEAQGDYTVRVWKFPWGAAPRIVFNYTHPDPVKREIFRDLRFRQAMSLAIDREEYNDVIFLGRAVPRQFSPVPPTTFLEPWMEQHFAEHDPERASALLDEMGLERGAAGFRLRPDGQTLELELEFLAEGTVPFPDVAELMQKYWQEVGVKINLQLRERSLLLSRGRANEKDIGFWPAGLSHEFGLFVNPAKLYPAHGTAFEGVNQPWLDWYNSHGAQGEEPEPAAREIFALIDEWQLQSPGSAEYDRLGREILTKLVNQLYLIGTIGLGPKPILIRNDVGNVTPDDDMLFGFGYGFWNPYGVDQWYLK